MRKTEKFFTSLHSTMLRCTFFIIVLQYLLLCSTSSTVNFGLIRNTSVIFNNSMGSTFSGTFRECLCRLFSDSNSLGFNYFSNNNTCLFHFTTDRNKIMTTANETIVSFYFMPSSSQNTETMMNPTSSGNKWKIWNTLRRFDIFI